MAARRIDPRAIAGGAAATVNLHQPDIAVALQAQAHARRPINASSLSTVRSK